MKRPLPITVMSILALVNGGVTCLMGLMTLLGSRVLFTPSGYGPNRIAIAEVFGPLSGQAGWVVLTLGVLFALVGYGLFTLRWWARLTLFWVFAVAAAATLVAVGWGVYHGEVGVAVTGLLKVAADSVVCWYFSRPGVREAFARSRR